MGAENGTLAFMVGGPKEAFDKAQPVFQAMGKTIVHCGGPGNGQVVKACNNMMLAVTMIGTCEAFIMAEKLGVPAQTLFDVTSKATSQSWALTSYCPVPGPVPASPANRDYKPGFAAALMEKDLGLAQQAAADAGMTAAMGAKALALYQAFTAEGGGGQDFSGIVEMLRRG
jgi:3-hydroxyisobutyrate dehydrogenase